MWPCSRQKAAYQVVTLLGKGQVLVLKFQGLVKVAQQTVALPNFAAGNSFSDLVLQGLGCSFLHLVL